MFSSIFGKSRESNEVLLREKRVAHNLFERAMANKGVNSDEANFWAKRLDEAEAKLKA